MTKLSPFDFITSICEGKYGKDLFAEARDIASDGLNPNSPEKQYSAFMVNRGLSQHVDAVLLANEMNRRAHLPGRMQYDFLRFSIRPRRRMGKWAKREDDDNLELIKRAYGYSSEKARQVLTLHGPSQIKELKARLSIGGMK